MDDPEDEAQDLAAFEELEDLPEATFAINGFVNICRC